jgi:hypothetical protein
VWAKQSITEDLTAYAAEHDDVQQLLDPLYLMFAHPLHMGFAAAVAAYPTVGSPAVAPALFNPGMPFIFQFAANHLGTAEARQFLGHVQALCPGQRAVMYRTAVVADLA